MLVRALPPVVSPETRVLILGSMPGVESLLRQQYYAHPRNRFWPLMESLCRAVPGLPYQDRLGWLLHAQLGLWDVFGECVRQGSLDADIVAGSEVANDIPQLLERFPGVQAVALNGRKAADAYRRMVVPALNRETAARVHRLELPSTSPANAARSLERLADAWVVIHAHLDGMSPS